MKRGAATFVVVLVVVLVGGTFYYSEVLDDDLLQADPWVPEFDTEVLAVADSFVTLSLTEESLQPGIQGLEWADGYALVGRVLGETEDTVTRELPEGAGALVVGLMVAIDPFAFENDPDDVELAFSEVLVESDFGEFPAWRIDGTDDTWAIFVHGKGASRREGLRILPTLHEVGLTTLLITYRNDVEAPPTDNGRYGVGATEWPDLEAAVRYALANGAQDVVLVGYSMGGSIVSMFMYESDLADRVQGIILDAPLLDVGVAVDQGAADIGVPGFLTGWAKALSTMRFGIDWGELDHVERAAEFSAPILLIHGNEDDTVPIRSSDEFAAARPDLVTYLEFDADHVRSWNADPERYETAVSAFVTREAVGLSDLDPILGDRSDQ